METDTFFTGTRAHPICQDYARVGTAGIALSDGCSSSPDTDVGARALTIAGLEMLDSDPNHLEHSIYEARRSLPTSVPVYSLDATLLLAQPTPTGVQAFVSGDGVVVGRQRADGAFVIYDFDCANMPTYLSYLLDDTRLQAYCVEGGSRTITVTKRVGAVSTTLAIAHENPFTGKCDYPGEAKPFYRTLFPADRYDLVVLFSDGVKSFRDQKRSWNDDKTLPLGALLDDLLAFKSYAGSFVTRRARAFFQQCTCCGWINDDDFSMAAVYLDEGGH